MSHRPRGRKRPLRGRVRPTRQTPAPERPALPSRSRTPLDGPLVGVRRAMRMAAHVVDTAGAYPGELLDVAGERLRTRTGPVPALDAGAVLRALLAHLILGGDPQIAGARRRFDGTYDTETRAAAGLHPNAGRITYRMFEHSLDRLVTAFSDPAHDHPVNDDTTEGQHPCPAGCPSRKDLQWLCTGLLAASVATDLLLSGHCALDSTDAETWARRRGWGSGADISPDSLEVVRDEIDPARTVTVRVPGRKDRTTTSVEERVTVWREWQKSPASTTTRVPGSRKPSRVGPTVAGPGITSFHPDYPQIGPTGRIHHTAAPLATEGWRSGKNGKRSDTFNGDDDHLITTAPSKWDDGPATCQQIIAMVSSPAGSHKGHAGLRTVLEAASTGFRMLSVSLDRGYTVPKADTFLHPVRDLGVDLHFDLATQQRGPNGTLVRGAIVVDGWLFTDALPETLRDLKTPGRNATPEERAANAALYDLRAAYAYRTHGKPDAHGRRKLIGPAAGGHVVCANHGPSQRRKVTATRPETACEAGTPCSCSHVVTVIPEDFDGLDQWPLLGTTAWQKHYFRRVQVESVNSLLKTTLGLVRTAVRCVDDTKARLLRALSACAANLLAAHSFRVHHRLTDPWGPYEDHLVPVTGSVDPAPPWLSSAEKAVPVLLGLDRRTGRNPEATADGAAEPA